MDIYSLLVTRNPGATEKKLRWCIDEPAKEQRYSDAALQQGLLIRGWVLCEQNANLQMFVKQSQAELLFPVNIKRADVVQRLLKQPAEQHRQLMCGFSFSVPLSQDKFDIGVLIDDEPVVLANVEVVGQLKVLQGDEGWLFLDNDNNNSVEQFTGKKLLGWRERRKWLQYAKGLQQIAREQQVPYALLIAPSERVCLCRSLSVRTW
ncbi:hypothetical protein [Arsukibacterium sp.]|uniref:hypothetical protein n=1 Tax=Arsukibacterium sp. TaxID=1977258 RepID=UPI001BD3AD3B|nr:hypothetical protein [Arsukibacterium sp.]